MFWLRKKMQGNKSRGGGGRGGVIVVVRVRPDWCRQTEVATCGSRHNVPQNQLLKTVKSKGIPAAWKVLENRPTSFEPTSSQSETAGNLDSFLPSCENFLKCHFDIFDEFDSPIGRNAGNKNRF